MAAEPPERKPLAPQGGTSGRARVAKPGPRCTFKYRDGTKSFRTVNDGRKHQWRGSRTEAKVTSGLIDLGVAVSVPIFGSHRYDLIMDRNGELERVQVKTAYEHNSHEDVIVVSFVSMVYGSDGTPQRSYYTSDEIDSYIVYCPKRDEMLYVQFEETPKTAMHFSFKEPCYYNPGNRKNVNFAEEYLLHGRL